MAAALYFLFTLSGTCALVYQLLWTRWLGLLLGNFATATCLVVTVFMGGLAMGNSIGGWLAASFPPRLALRAYGVFELLLATLTAASPLVLDTGSPLYSRMVQATAHPVGGALVCVILLLPPTLLMGATFPAVVQALGATAPSRLGGLYSLNTLGGAMGPLLAAFLFLPTWGLKTTQWSTSGLNALLGCLAVLLSRSWPEKSSTVRPSMGQQGTPAGEPRFSRLPYILAGLSGFISLGFEIALTRFFSLTITGGSVYGFAIILSAFLVGLALGAWLVRLSNRGLPRHALLLFAGAQAVAYLFSLTTPFWDRLPELLVQIWWRPIPFLMLNALNFTAVLLLMLVLTAAFGYALPVLAAALPSADSRVIGRLFAANTLGAVLGAVVCGFVFIRLLGLGATLLLLGILGLVTAGSALIAARRSQLVNVLAAAPLLAVVPLVLPAHDDRLMSAGMYDRPLAFRPDFESEGGAPSELVEHRGQIIYQKDSLTGRVAVRSTSPLSLSCIVNGKPDGSTTRGDMYTQIFMAHLPALAHPHPRNALVIGLGTGITVGSLGLHPSVEEIHVVEIEPAQVEVAKIFRNFNYNVADDPRVRIHLEDARRFLLLDPGEYDLIISEPSNLWVSGMVNLFTREFYELARRRLKPGGVFFQWIHYYRVHEADLQGVLRTFLTVNPGSTFWIHAYGDGFLMFRDGGLKVDIAAWRRRMEAPGLKGDLARLELSPQDLASFFLWGPADIAAYAGAGTLCTDDFPYLEFTTPKTRYVREKDSEALRLKMQSFAPLELMPIVEESPDTRQELGDLLLRRESTARSDEEHRRARELRGASVRPTVN